METSDHVPCVITIPTDIPKSINFRFENYWMEHEDFLCVVQHGWNVTTQQVDKSKIISAKFKNLKRLLKAWQSKVSNIKKILIILNLCSPSLKS